MKFSCSCGQSITVPDEFAGKKGLCPGCRKLLTVPTLDQVGAVAAVAAVAAVGPAPAAAGSTCTICQTTIAAGEEVTACPQCRLGYHAACWAENGGCATYGCPAAPKTAKAAESAGADGSRQGWGDTKKCPYCGETIRAAALKCKFCNEVFPSADPLTARELRQEETRKLQRVAERSRATTYFVISMLSLGAPVTAAIGGLWIFRDRSKFKKLDATDQVLVLAGFGVSCLVAMIMLIGIVWAIVA